MCHQKMGEGSSAIVHVGGPGPWSAALACTAPRWAVQVPGQRSQCALPLGSSVTCQAHSPPRARTSSKKAGVGFGPFLLKTLQRALLVSMKPKTLHPVSRPAVSVPARSTGCPCCPAVPTPSSPASCLTPPTAGGTPSADRMLLGTGPAFLSRGLLSHQPRVRCPCSLCVCIVCVWVSVD